MSSSSISLRLVLILGLLSAVGPFAIDMYLPALPQIGASLNAPVGAVQASLTAFFIALGVGQPMFGTLSDMWGRKKPLYLGLIIFIVASIGCALAQDINTLVTLRFVQGLGAAAGMAIPRAVVRDRHTGHEAARMMSLLMLVFSVSPILAPLVGSGLIAIGGWRLVFWVVSAAAALGLMAMVRGLPETRDADARLGSGFADALKAYAFLLRDWHYLGLVFIGACAMAGFFVYLAGSPFVLINYYGLSATEYSMAFAFNAISFIGAAQFTGALGKRFGLVNVVKAAATGSGVVMLTLLGYYLMGGEQLAVLIGLYFVASALMGLVIPTTSVLALEEHGEIAGTASALLGTLQMLTGAVAMQVVGLFSNGKPLPMVIGMALGALCGVMLTWVTLGGAAKAKKYASSSH